MTGFLDAPSRAAEPFWLAVTGSTLSPRRGPGGEFATLVPPDGDAYLRVQVVGSPRPGTHLDLHVTDVPAAAGEAVALGARVILDEGSLVVLDSPGGLAFCLVAWAGEAVVPAVPAWRSVVDQVSLDIPVTVFEAEAGFWAELTGWPRRPANLPEFHHLKRAPGMPLRLLLQRTLSGPAGMHVDLACDDVAAEVARHVGLGAQVVRRVPEDWTTLRDPVGREYCVTARGPTL
jgi:hypothetical protein